MQRGKGCGSNWRASTATRFRRIRCKSSPGLCPRLCPDDLESGAPITRTSGPSPPPPVVVQCPAWTQNRSQHHRPTQVFCNRSMRDAAERKARGARHRSRGSRTVWAAPTRLGAFPRGESLSQRMPFAERPGRRGRCRRCRRRGSGTGGHGSGRAHCGRRSLGYGPTRRAWTRCRHGQLRRIGAGGHTHASHQPLEQRQDEEEDQQQQRFD